MTTAAFADLTGHEYGLRVFSEDLPIPVNSRLCLALFGMMLLAGCKTTENYEKVLNTWVGSSERLLLERWGPPSGVYESGGLKYLTYASSRSGYIPGTTPNYQTTIIGNTAYTTSYGGSAGYAYTKSCKTSFTLRDSKIISWRYEGNDCIADSPPETYVEDPALNKKIRDNYERIDADRREYYRNKKRKCQKGEEIKMLSTPDCEAWGGKRIYGR